LLGHAINLRHHLPLIASSAIYVCSYNLFDLFKQYLYTTDNQVYSLRCTSIYIAIQLIGLGWIFFDDKQHEISATVYFLFTLCLVVSLLTNRQCINALRNSQWHSWRYVGKIFSRYFEQGRFSLQGMTLTWLQKQSMNPLLMVISGPLLVGYFNLGRLIVMPLNVMMVGLINSSTPTLRRVFQKDGAEHLTSVIKDLARKNMIFTGVCLCFPARRCASDGPNATICARL